MQHTITPCLWFNDDAEQAAAFYTSVFRDGTIHNVAHYLAETPSNKPVGSVLQVDFQIEGQSFTALNGGDFFTPTPAVSFFVNRDSVEEVVELWEKLSEGGTILMPLGEYPFSKQYGWVQDKYGISWQVMFANPEGTMRPSIVPCFLFTKEVSGRAEEALRYYMAIFSDTDIGQMVTYETDTGVQNAGDLMFGDIRIGQQWFAAMDGGTPHEFGFTEGISFQVFCDSQEEIDMLHEKLSAEPDAAVCGWVKDKFGVSWQIVPAVLGALLDESNPKKATRVMAALLKMKKLDIATLEAA